ncbi:uncharacterized protein T551_01084 [Pneumocystis jirovecii RU7]|uniref:RING-type domain-containing protein n=1 Tax=Pneumocystis jirovecii (strain RU7) TaxID=1408657 RepID=A0A0W4ZTW3_PNEJ7|nr:uncharacterized protein T551_01084 [Pneumocystis jirovecii RU7]KTW31823.1 hypothetical protein T551_01084 [Pneumocystis jirovecii RU7]
MSTYEDDNRFERNLEQQKQNTVSESRRHRENLISFLSETLQEKKTSFFEIDNVFQNYSMNTLSSVTNLLMSQFMNDFENTKTNLPENFMDTLDRVPLKMLKPDDICSICKVGFLEDKYPFVVKLNCGHKFDECISLWLKINATCPVCRRSVVKEKPVVPQDDEYDSMYS